MVTDRSLLGRRKPQSKATRPAADTVSNTHMSMTHEHTEYVTRDELAARLAEFELRIADRLALFEQRMNDHFKAQTRMLIGLYASVAIAAIVFAVKG